MAKTVDLRTYIALEKAFVRRLQRSWRIQSAPIYAKIAQACNDHKWDEARRLVTDLDMTEVGTQNREWITYMLLSCAVFGANMVAKGRPSFVGVGTFDTFLKQVTNNFLMYLENAGTTRVQAEALQSIAEDEAKTKALKYDPDQLRDEKGQWAKGGKAGVRATDIGNTFLHGTAQAFLGDILRNGIRGEHGGRIHPTDQRGRTLALPGHVYMTTDLEEAKKYAESAGISDELFNKNKETILNPVYMEGYPRLPEYDPHYESGTEIGGGMPCVVTIELPPEVVRKLRKDRRSDILTPGPYEPGGNKRVLSDYARSYKGNIKPEWIKSISYATRDIAIGETTWHTIDAKDWKEPGPTTPPYLPAPPDWELSKEWKDYLKTKKAADGTVFYIPMLIPVPALKWDESEHPRDAETGRFVQVTVAAVKKSKHGAFGKRLWQVDVEVPDDPSWEANAHAKALPLLQEVLPKLKITTEIVGVTRKWDEAKHPRGAKGRFTFSAYHGSNVAGIKEFKAKYGAIPGWFSEHEDLASQYADIKTRFAGGAATVYPVRLTIKNPIVIHGDMNAKTTYREERERTGLKFTVGKYGDEFVDGVEQRYTRYEIITSSEFVNAAKAKGYDGIKVNESGHHTWGVFDSKQVEHIGQAHALTDTTRLKARHKARAEAEKWRAITAKWDEAEHPRDKEGQFTKAQGVYDVGHRDVQENMEGGGPARAEWLIRNKAAIDAMDAVEAAKNSFLVLEPRLRDKYHQEGFREAALVERFQNDPEWIESNLAWEKASQVAYEAEQRLKEQTPLMRIEVVTNLSTQVANQLGVRLSYIEVVDEDPIEFDVGNQHFTEAGHFSPADGMVTLNVRSIHYNDADAVKGATAHELSHLIYHTMKGVVQREKETYDRLSKAPEGIPFSAFDEFKAAKVLSTLSERGALFGGISQKMITENGHSAYAKSYWTPEAIRARGGYETAINETMAELTRYITHPESWNEKTTPSPTSPWLKLTKDMHAWHKERQARIQASMARNKA